MSGKKSSADEPDELIAELTRLAPVPPAQDLPPGRHNALAELMMTEITRAEPRPAPPEPSIWWRRRTVLVPTLVMILVAAGIAALVIRQPGAPRALPAEGDAPAVALLAKVADMADRQTQSPVSDSQYVYVDSMVAFGHSTATVGPDGTVHEDGGEPAGAPHQRQVWISVADLCRTGLVRQMGEDLPLTHSGGGPCPDRGFLNDPTFRLLASLPTDPYALLARIHADTAGHGSGADAEAFITIGDLLRESIAPPQVSAALYRAAALIPGVTVVRDVTDAIGRHGTAVARVDNGELNEWIFDPTTHQLIGERDVLARDVPGLGHAGDVVGVTAILAKKIVDGVGRTS